MPGDTFSFLVRISGTTALAGYTVDLRVTPQAGSTGEIVGDASLSNFHAVDNLIAQGGNGLHATFSTIESLLPANPGLLINGLDAAFMATAIPGPGQDVLAEVVMTASNDAFGDFEVSLGDDTALLVDGNESHNEPYPPAMITISIPEPGYLGMLAGLSLGALRRRRKRA